jgi:hypothetical protein
LSGVEGTVTEVGPGQSEYRVAIDISGRARSDPNGKDHVPNVSEDLTWLHITERAIVDESVR